MKDRLDLELRSIMEEETKEISISNELKNRIIEKSRKSSLRGKISTILNRYIEIPMPVAIGILTALVIINLTPIKNIDLDFNYGDTKIIRIGSSQVIVENIKDVNSSEKD